MDGGIISYGVPQLFWRLRVARGPVEDNGIRLRKEL